MIIRNLPTIFGTILLLCLYLCSYSQTIQVNAGRSLFPGDYVSVRYTHYSNGPVNLAGGMYLESSRKFGLNYNVYGAELLAQCGFRNQEEENDLFNCKAAFGAVWQMENEPWVFSRMQKSKKMNYGLVIELEGEFLMSESFGLLLFAQQKYLFNKSLGTAHFDFGIGLKFHFSNL